jgi:predicted glycoside hydrolase/deacetylase ChbG (UPF0249 family)
MKQIVLCADDYGQNSAISQAIIELFDKKRLSATSCLSTSLEWPTQAIHLEPFKHQVDLGLHFNLTEGMPLSDSYKASQNSPFLSVSQLILQSYLNQLDKKKIKAELEAQLEQFLAGCGKLPDFVDGHQHIHQLPIVRDAILEVWNEKLKKYGSYIRCTASPWFRKNKNILKQWIIQLCGSSALKRKLVDQSVPHNSSFAGIYDFSGGYDNFFPDFLQKVGNQGLIMCHPGLESNGDNDEIAAARYREYQYFMSDSFVADCQQQEVKIVRFKEFVPLY